MASFDTNILFIRVTVKLFVLNNDTIIALFVPDSAQDQQLYRIYQRWVERTDNARVDFFDNQSMDKI